MSPRIHLLLVAGLGLGGCFGDWVRAKPHPRREDLPEVAPAPEPDRGPPHPCRAYRTQILEVCTNLLEGRVEGPSCYAEVLKLSGKGALDAEEVDPNDGLTARQRSCRGDWRGLVAARERGKPREVGPVGPRCRELAGVLRERCIEPLSDVDAMLPTKCGSWLMTMQSIVRGREARREDACTRLAGNLAERGDETSGGEAGSGPGPGA